MNFTWRWPIWRLRTSQTDRESELTGQSTIGPGAFTASQLMCILGAGGTVPAQPRYGPGRGAERHRRGTSFGLGAVEVHTQARQCLRQTRRVGRLRLLPGKDGSAQNRRINLVEYAVSTLLVTAADLPLDAPSPTEHDEGGANETSADTLG